MSNAAVVTPPTSRPLARASEHLAAGRLAEAAGAFKAVLQIDPNETQAHLGLAQCAVGRGQHDVAYEHFLRTAKLLRERGANDDALRCYGYAVSSDPSRIDIHVDIAELELELGRREAALARLDGLAEAYLVADREDDAVAILEFINELNGDAGAEVAHEPEMFTPGAFEAGAIAAPVRDTEGTMVISTFLLTPDGAPFGQGAPPPLAVSEPRATARITEVPTAAPRATVVPTAARATVVPTATRATIVPTAARAIVPPMGTPAPVVDDPSAVIDDPSAAMALSSLTDDPRWTVPHPPADDDDVEIEIDSSTRRPASPVAAIAQAVHDEDSAELAASAVDEPDVDTTSVRAKPLPKAAPAPSSVDAQGRSLAERLRTARSRAAAAAPTAPQKVVAAPVPKPAPAAAKPVEAPRPAVRTAPPIGAGSTRPTPTTSKPTSTTATPSRTASRPAAGTPTAARPSATATRPSTGASKPTAAARPSTAAARPTSTAKPAAARPTAIATARPTPPSKPTPQPPMRAAAASTPARNPNNTGDTVVSPRPTAASPGRTTAMPSRPTAPPAKPLSSRTTAVSTSKPAAAAPRAQATPSRAASPSANKPAATRGAAPAPSPAVRGNQPAVRPAAQAEPKRVMAVRTRAPAPVAPGVPIAVGPARTLPLVIPPPPREEFDDQNTVIFRGDP